MVIYNKHLTMNEYIKFLDDSDITDRTRGYYKTLYAHVIDKWNRPSDWIDDNDKKISFCGVSSNSYWYS